MSGTGFLLKKLASRSARFQVGVAGRIAGFRYVLVRPGFWGVSGGAAAAAPSLKKESPVVSAVGGFNTPPTLTYWRSWALMSSGVSTRRETLICGSGISWPSHMVDVKCPYAPSVRIAFCAAVA